MKWNPFGRRKDQPASPDHQPSPAFPDVGADEHDGHGEPAPPGDIADVEMIGSVAVATLTVTELSQEAGAERLANLLVELGETGAAHFILDVQNVQYMDTACLGCLVEALNRLAADGGRIALVNPNHSVSYIFRLTRLDRVFRICNDVPTALEAVDPKMRDAG
jgi:anti-sigma B factor antagonist